MTRRRDRDPYLDVGERTRHTLEHAATVQLTPTEHHALLAVIHVTTTRSRHGDHVYLAHLAALTYGVDQPDDWMLPKTRKALARLRTLAVLEVEPPRGRPAAPSYWVGHLDPSEAQCKAARSEAREQASRRRASHPARPDTGPRYARPAPGSSTAQSGTQQGPLPGRSSALARPEAGPPTEVFSEGNRGGKTEDDDADGSPGADYVGPATADDAHDDGEEWRPDQLTRLLTATIDPTDPYGPNALEVATIDAHLAQHIPEMRDLIARTAPALEHGEHRLILRHARNVATAHASDLPRLDLPRRVP